MTDVPMFAAPPPPEPRLSKHLQRCKLAKGEKVSYTAISAKAQRQQCTECVWVLHEAGGKGWSINAAAMARKDESGERILLCHPHGRLWKRLDGVGETRKRAAGRRR